jgi:hypothetical protein
MPRVHGDDATVAATEDVVIFVASSQVDSQGRDAVRRVEEWGERDPLAVAAMKDAEKGRLPVVGAEAGGELAVGNEP